MKVTNADRQALAELYSGALKSQASMLAATPAADLDIKSLFCQHWDELKQILEWLKTAFPMLSIFIGGVILAGDTAHKHFCQG